MPPAPGPQRHPQRAFGAGGQVTFGGLAVDQEPARRGQSVGRARAVGAHFFSHEKQEPHALLAIRDALSCGRQHGGGDALRVARPTPVEPVALAPRRDVRSHRVQVGRECHARLPRCLRSRRPNVAAAGRDFLDRDVPVPRNEPPRDELNDRTLVAARRRDGQELGGQCRRVDRLVVGHWRILVAPRHGENALAEIRRLSPRAADR